MGIHLYDGRRGVYKREILDEDILVDREVKSGKVYSSNEPYKFACINYKNNKGINEDQINFLKDIGEKHSGYLSPLEAYLVLEDNKFVSLDKIDIDLIGKSKISLAILCEVLSRSRGKKVCKVLYKGLINRQDQD